MGNVDSKKDFSKTNLIIIILFIVSFILGLIGIGLLEPEMSWDNRVYYVLRLCTLNNEVLDESSSLILRIARIMCPVCWMIFVATVLVNLKTWFYKIVIFFKTFKKGVTAIWGDGKYADYIALQLGDKSIREKISTVSVRADKQLLFFDKMSDLLEFLDMHSTELNKNKEIKIISDEFEPTTFENKNFEYIYLPERVAMNYWRMRPLKGNENNKIAIIGFSKYAQSILIYALKINVGFINFHNEYHVFLLDGESKDFFLRKHWNISNVITDNIQATDFKDCLIFHEPNEWQSKDLLNEFERIIISSDSDDKNLHILHDLKFISNVSVVDVRIAQINPEQNILYDGSHNKDFYFGEVSSALINDRQNLKDCAYAMLMNYLYDVIFGDEPLCLDSVSGKAKEKWKKLSTKIKRSNLFSVTHIEKKLELMKYYDISIEESIECKYYLKEIIAAYYLDLIERYKDDELFRIGFSSEGCHGIKRTTELALGIKKMITVLFTSDVSSLQEAKACLFSYVEGKDIMLLKNMADALLEGEHERWRRDYYLDNWVYGEEKNNMLRKHNNLVPFSKLTDNQEKDWLMYWVIMLTSSVWACDFDLLSGRS